MAGEWLKFDCTLPEKQETLAITAVMGWDDPDTTVGKLMRLFRWFDQQTIDGNAANVTPALLDRVMGVSGFVSAVVSVGWIIVNDSGLSLANFDRHNGATAKSRVLTAKRVANHKTNALGNAKGNAVIVSEALPRVEKSRVEKNIDSVAKATGAKAPMTTDPEEIIFGYGLALLINAGTADKVARSFLGGLRKHHGDESLIDKLRECVKAKPLQPLEWLAAALPPAGAKPKPNMQEVLEASNRAIASRFLENQNHAA